MRLVVSGYYGYGNAGDEAVLAGLLAALREIEPAASVTVLSGDPAETRRTHGVDAIPRARPGTLIGALRASDGLLSGGGSLLQDRTSARPVAYYTGVMGVARLARRPYVMHAQGLGPITRAGNRWLAALALRGAAHVSLRDDASVDLARRLGVRRPIEVVPDPALGLRPARGNTTDGPIVVAVRDWGTSAAHVAGLREGLRRLAIEHRVLALPMQEPGDRPASEAAIEGVSNAEVVVPGATLDEKLAVIGAASAVVGMRLHALILAAAAHVPAVAISYDPKVDAFAGTVGQSVVGGAGTPLDATVLERAVRDALSADPAGYVERVEGLRGGVIPSVRRTVEALRASG